MKFSEVSGDHIDVQNRIFSHAALVIGNSNNCRNRRTVMNRLNIVKMVIT